MAGITIADAETALALWLAADAALAGSQSYEISVNGSMRKLTRADAAEVRANIDYWQDWVTKLSRTRGRTRYVVPS